MIALGLAGWRENDIYPGTHWMYYDHRANYRARVDLNTWTKGRYQWRVLHWGNGEEDETGYEYTLEDAQRMAEAVMEKKDFQLRLI